MVQKLHLNMFVRLAAITALILSVSVDALTVGEHLPAISLQSLDGETYATDDFRGKVLVLYLMGYA